MQLNELNSRQGNVGALKLETGTIWGVTQMNLSAYYSVLLAEDMAEDEEGL